MPFAPGKRLGSYEIVAAIGAGGMGEVYRARDIRLERTVAIKVLPEQFSADPDFRQRFEREAKAISSLSHPHICTLYDVGSEGGVEYLVMEHLDGETLAQRLVKGPLPFTQVLRHAVEIAEALDRAHRQGVTHRDLKPGNVMLTKAGAKLLDFGLAKLKTTPEHAPSGAATARPEPLTESGTLLGTLQYMAPEQVEGKAADHRADIFAFGAIVYEMATGKKAFEGDTQARLIGAIMRDEPQPVSALQPLAPPAFDALVATALAKDADERWQSAGDLARQLRLLRGSSPSHPRLTGSMPGAAAQTGHDARSGVRGTLIGTAAAVASGLAVWGFMRPSPPEPEPVSRFEITTPAAAPLTSLAGYDVAISPDGRRVAYVAQSGPATVQLYVRELGELEAKPIPGTEVPSNDGSPFFSADGRSIAFRAADRLMRVPVEGGTPLEVAALPSGTLTHGVWTAEDTVIFADGEALYRVSAGGGGTLERLTPPAVTIAVAPVLLPGGRGLLYGTSDRSINATGAATRVMAMDLIAREPRVVVEGSENAAYAPSGHLIFARDKTLFAQPFDVQRLETTADAVAVLQGVRRQPNTAADFALAASGTLAYVPDTGARPDEAALVWVDRAGRAVERVVDGLSRDSQGPSLSRDGRQFVLAIQGRDGPDLWVHDLGGRPPIPLTAAGVNQSPVWSPDGKIIAFISNRSAGGSANAFAIHTLPADGSVRVPRLVEPRISAGPQGWTSGGELIAVRRGTGQGDIVALRLEDGTVRDVIATPDLEESVALSPDERWLAYVSDRTGELEVWVMRYPDGVPQRVSRNGGAAPVWSRDGRELVYLQADGTMVAVAVTATPDALSFGAPEKLFATTPFLLGSDRRGRPYDVAADGRFLMLESTRGGGVDANTASIVVVENWVEEVKQRVPLP